MRQNITKLEIGIFAALVIYFLFAATNINPQLGDIYAIFSLATLIFILLDPKRDIPFRKDSDSIFGSMAVGVGAYVALITIGTFVLIPIVSKVISLFAATTPVLASNSFFQFVTFAIAIPITETYFFFMVMYDLGASLFNVNIDKRNLTSGKLWSLIIGIALLFMFFHLTAKGIGATDVLTLVFFMAIVSMLIITWFKTGEAAVYLHIVANAIPSLPLLGFTIINFIGIKIENKKNNGNKKQMDLDCSNHNWIYDKLDYWRNNTINFFRSY
jgi:hypothetical protein